MVERTFEVLVIGGGPVGLSAGIQLARAGVRTLVVERRDTLSRHPKALGIHPRTMELFRQWGVADAVGALSVLPERSRGFGWTTRIKGGIPLGELLFNDGTVQFDPASLPSPEWTTFTSQDNVELILHEHLVAFPSAQFEFGTRAEVVGQDGDGVTVTLTTADGQRTIRVAYVVGADGTRSPTRKSLGVTEAGTPVYGESVAIYFHSEMLTRLTAALPYMLTWVVNADQVGSMVRTGRQDRWIFNFERDPAVPDEAYDDAFCAEQIRLAAGDPSLELEILNTARWKHETAVADTWRVGRVLLAGDAVHRFPPHGGFGMNSGVLDAYNLIWKLVRVLRGEAGEALLDTYEQERKPVAQYNEVQVMLNTKRMEETGWLAENGAEIAKIELPEEGKAVRQGIQDAVPAQREQFWSDGQQFGYVYSSTAVIDDGTEAEVSTVSEYRPTGHPGARAPHVWLTDEGGRRRSTVELATDEFVVLAGSKGRDWREAAKSLGIDGWVIGEDLVPENVDFEARYGIEPSGAVLVRPDGHVAFRARTGTDCVAVLTAALARLSHY
jgi:putative polyketide hydroxylase